MLPVTMITIVYLCVCGRILKVFSQNPSGCGASTIYFAIPCNPVLAKGKRCLVPIGHRLPFCTNVAETVMPPPLSHLSHAATLIVFSVYLFMYFLFFIYFFISFLNVAETVMPPPFSHLSHVATLIIVFFLFFFVIYV